MFVRSASLSVKTLQNVYTVPQCISIFLFFSLELTEVTVPRLSITVLIFFYNSNNFSVIRNL
nr:MAG TPA: hypothetical protein [Caudoviricetes sp.]